MDIKETVVSIIITTLLVSLFVLIGWAVYASYQLSQVPLLLENGVIEYVPENVPRLNPAATSTPATSTPPCGNCPLIEV